MSLVAKIALAPLLVAQALHVRRSIPRLPEAQGPRSGVAGTGWALRLLVIGDSSAAGVGVSTQQLALAAPLAGHLAELTGAAVHWQLLARSGLTTAQALEWLRAEPALAADVAVIVTGVNDVVDQVPSGRAVGAREALANWLRNGAGVHHVVFAPLPPVGRFPGLPQPLRWIAGADARRHDRALARWAGSRGDVSMAGLGHDLERSAMARDGFHPGAPAYLRIATDLAEHIAAKVWPRLPGETT